VAEGEADASGLDVPPRTRRSNGSTTPGPVPQVMWNRGTELPCPSARPSPRSAQPTTGKTRWPISRSQARFSPAAKSRYASAHCARPVVLLAIELRAAEPVLTRQLGGVLDPHPPLLGAVDHEQPAEGPECLAAEVLLSLLVDQHDAAAGVGQPLRQQRGRPGQHLRR
jgi:hypothetical protein